jgi:hypothetical protein
VIISLAVDAPAHTQPMMNPLRQLALSSEDFAMVNQTVAGLY